MVTDDGKLRVRHHGQIVAEIPNRELADEAPLYHRPYTRPPQRPEAPVKARWVNPQDALPALMASADICSKRWIWEQYDYQVRTNTVAGPGARSGDCADQGDGKLGRDFARWQRALLRT